MGSLGNLLHASKGCGYRAQETAQQVIILSELERFCHGLLCIKGYRPRSAAVTTVRSRARHEGVKIAKLADGKY
ncbi:MAG: hypothetical protein P8J33_09555 [Pirellulaceae bacterium]|nr:hypothetical protein [Pirellulaceae bacterium]